MKLNLRNNMNLQQLLEQRNKDFYRRFTNIKVIPKFSRGWINGEDLIKSHIAETNRLLIEKVVEMAENKKKDNFEHPQTILGLEPDDGMWNSGFKTALDDIINELTKQQ